MAKIAALTVLFRVPVMGELDLGLFIVAPGRDRDGRLVVVCSDISLAQKMMRETNQLAVSRAFSMFFWELGQSEDAQLLGRVPQVREPVRWYPGAFPCPPCRS